MCGILISSRKLAEHLALGAPPEKAVLIDAFAGAGGNTIAFARSGRWKRVYGIEKDPQVLECAKHNAEVYGVQHLVSWYQGDCFELIKKELADLGEFAVLFASPPWGGKLSFPSLPYSDVAPNSQKLTGPGYRSQQIYDLQQMEPYPLAKLITPFRALTKDVALYLPRTSDLRQFLRHIEDGQQKMTVVHYCMEGRSKVGPMIGSVLDSS